MSWFGRRRDDDRDTGPDAAQRERAAAEWKAWRDEVFGNGYEVWHDGPDTHASTARWLAEPERTERLLVYALTTDDDAVPYAVERFTTSGHTPGPDVVAALVAATAEDRPRPMRVEALRASWVVTGDPAFVSGLVQVLRRRHGSNADRARSSAAIALRDVPPTAEVADALADAVAHDGQYLVRYHAADSLLSLAGRDPGPALQQPAVETLSDRGSKRDRAVLARQLRDLVRTTG